MPHPLRAPPVPSPASLFLQIGALACLREAARWVLRPTAITPGGQLAMIRVRMAMVAISANLARRSSRVPKHVRGDGRRWANRLKRCSGLILVFRSRLWKRQADCRVIRDNRSRCETSASLRIFFSLGCEQPGCIYGPQYCRGSINGGCVLRIG